MIKTVVAIYDKSVAICGIVSLLKLRLEIISWASFPQRHLHWRSCTLDKVLARSRILFQDLFVAAQDWRLPEGADCDADRCSVARRLSLQHHHGPKFLWFCDSLLWSLCNFYGLFGTSLDFVDVYFFVILVGFWWFFKPYGSENQG